MRPDDSAPIARYWCSHPHCCYYLRATLEQHPVAAAADATGDAAVADGLVVDDDVGIVSEMPNVTYLVHLPSRALREDQRPVEAEETLSRQKQPPSVLDTSFD